MAKFNAADFTVAKAKPLPIIMLLDESGSMGMSLGAEQGTKIDVLNKAVKTMLATLSREETQASEFLVSIIAFGGSGAHFVEGARSTTAAGVNYHDLLPSGGTPLGAALSMAKQFVEDKQEIPSRSYRPLVVLVCDGMPNDSWQNPLNEFIGNGRTAKCDRMALAIGCSEGSPEWAMLEQFVEGTDNPVFTADQAGEIIKFFKFVTMSVTQRTQSQNPNQLIPAEQVLRLQSGEKAIEKADAIADYADSVEIFDAVIVEEDEDEEEGFRW
ncbi:MULTISPECIES: vWA domain-containing protein [unclassified Collinsella]|uniref:vWA domain-containing protein n=1 Tax=unclassified Collinsella TaxID=2637548 RepID=UPI003F8CB636